MVLRQSICKRFLCARLSNRILSLKASSQRYLFITRAGNYASDASCEASVTSALLNSKITSFAQSQMEEETQKRMKLKIVQDLNNFLKLQGVDFRIVPTGSSVNGFGMKDSDLDMVMIIDPSVDMIDKKKQKKLLAQFSGALRHYNRRGGQVSNIELVSRAKVPIATFEVQGMSCDVCVNNMVGLRNTMLLRWYNRLDKRLLHTAFFVKKVAQLYDINSSRHGSLHRYGHHHSQCQFDDKATDGDSESYNWNLLTIFYLQQVKVLPVLDEKVIKPGVQLGELSKYLESVEDKRKDSKFEGDKDLSVEELVAGFYKFYSDYDWNNWISVRTGLSLTPGSDGLLLPNKAPKKKIRIEEPFEGTNTARSVVPSKFQLIKDVIDQIALITANQQSMHVFIAKVKEGPKLEPKVPHSVAARKSKRENRNKPFDMINSKTEPDSKSLDSWAVFNLSDLPMANIISSVQAITQSSSSLDIISLPITFQTISPNKEHLEHAFRGLELMEQKLQLVFVILPETEGVYDRVKVVAGEYGFLTQCCRASTLGRMGNKSLRINLHKEFVKKLNDISYKTVELKFI